MAHVDLVDLVSQPPDTYAVLDKPPPAEPVIKRRVERERERGTDSEVSLRPGQSRLFRPIRHSLLFHRLPGWECARSGRFGGKDRKARAGVYNQQLAVCLFCCRTCLALGSGTPRLLYIAVPPSSWPTFTDWREEIADVSRKEDMRSFNLLMVLEVSDFDRADVI